MASTKARTRKCKVCPERFTPWNTLTVVCSPKCAVEHAALKLEKARSKAAADIRRETRRRREELKTKPELTKEAQQAFNAWVRERDADWPCISCNEYPNGGAMTGGAWDCGHYRSVGSAPEIRFEPLNAHRQCKRCNQHLSGNVVDYRIGLIKRIGLEKVEWLEGPHPMPNYTRDDLRAIRDLYRAKTRELKKERAA